MTTPTKLTAKEIEHIAHLPKWQPMDSMSFANRERALIGAIPQLLNHIAALDAEKLMLALCIAALKAREAKP